MTEYRLHNQANKRSLLATLSDRSLITSVKLSMGIEVSYVLSNDMVKLQMGLCVSTAAPSHDAYGQVLF